MKEAIQKAIEGGYENAFGNGDRVALCFLDPLFWQSYCKGDRIKGEELAVGLIKHLFKNGTAEEYFEQVASVGEKQ